LYSIKKRKKLCELNELSEKYILSRQTAIMYEYKQLFSQIGSKNEYIKIAVFLIFVAFLLFPVLGKKAAVIVGVVAFLFFCLGVAFWLKAIFFSRDKNDKIR